jgi:uncharacterized protein YjbI with pentapeptide repeats
MLLEKCPNLQQIDLGSTEITGEGFNSEAIKLEKLHEIHMFWCTKLTDEYLKMLLEKCPNLQKLNLSDTKITGEGFNSAAIKLENLHEIHISYCNNLTDDHLKRLIEKCPDLQKINLSGADITGQAFDSHDIKLENLHEIDISGCNNLTDKYLKILLEKSPNLRTLNLSCTNITQAGFDSLDIWLRKQRGEGIEKIREDVKRE